jgi:hypothetical protein
MLMFGARSAPPNVGKRSRSTEFERRQLSAVKKELDYEYETQTTLDRKTSKAATQTKYPALLRVDPALTRGYGWRVALASACSEMVDSSTMNNGRATRAR